MHRSQNQYTGCVHQIEENSTGTPMQQLSWEAEKAAILNPSHFSQNCSSWFGRTNSNQGSRATDTAVLLACSWTKPICIFRLCVSRGRCLCSRLTPTDETTLLVMVIRGGKIKQGVQKWACCNLTCGRTTTFPLEKDIWKVAFAGTFTFTMLYAQVQVSTWR